MKKNEYKITAILMIVCITIFVVGCESQNSINTELPAGPFVNASSDIEAGKYLVIVGGCNDCHTEGYLQTEGDVPEADWLTGSKLGWRGPWGTTYPKNLRLSVQQFSENEWVEILHTRKALPPMPWMNVNKISEKDARAVYRYIKSLGGKGEISPLPVPPGEEPKTPFLLLEPTNPI